MKKVKIISLLLVMTLTLAGCFHLNRRAPCQQKLSKWESVDGTIQFEVQATTYLEDSEITVDGRTLDVYPYYTPVLGTMNVNGEEIEFCVEFGVTEMVIYPIECLGVIEKDMDRYEMLECNISTERHYIATVTESTYLEEGQKIHFYRTYPE